MIYSCLQRVMGKIYVTDPDTPMSAMAVVGCFAFYAGEPNRELVKNKPDEKDRRKQRIILTEHCLDFCEKNDEMSRDIMKKMFAGISEKELSETIRIIMRIDNNMKEI